jgi:hypothetical protein
VVNYEDQGGDAGTQKDSDDQRRLRNVVAEEIEAIMVKHNVGGAVFLASKDSAAWRFVLPEWSALQFEGGIGMRFKGTTRTPEGRILFESTLHFLLAVRDMTRDCAALYADLYRCIEQGLPPGAVKHNNPFRGFGVGRSGE